MLLLADEARAKLCEGAKKLASAVKCTLGPGGHVVAMGGGKVTKDGVTVAKSVELEDEVEMVGVEIVRQAASKTADNAGDGTTTSTVIAEHLITTGNALLSGNSGQSQRLRRELEGGRDKVVEAIAKLSKKVKDRETLERIAFISSNQDQEMASVVAEAMHSVGESGLVITERGLNVGIESEIVEGMQLDKGYTTPHMATNKRMEAVYDSEPDKPVRVLVINYPIEKFDTLIDTLQVVQARNEKLVIFAKSFSHEVLVGLVTNRVRAGIMSLALEAISSDALEDVAAATGATLISESNGYTLEHVDMRFAGTAKTIVADAKRTIIREGGGRKLKSYLNELKVELEDATGRQEEKLKDRIARLEGKMAVIKLGAATDTELQERFDRLEDAIEASRSALQEGAVPGGGVAYIKASAELDETIDGEALLKEALHAPLRAIATNAGVNGDSVCENVLKNGGGYDASKLEYCKDLVKEGIIDPAKVARQAVENAVSVASSILTTECVSLPEPEDKDEK